jgi:amino acid adenylation domain-containing protein
MNVRNAERLVLDRRLNEERDYWLKRLSGELELSTGVAELALPRLGSSKEKVGITIAGDLYERFRKLTGGSPFLMYAFLMASLKVCLHKYSGRDVISVGSPALKALGRANALAIVGKVKDEMSFRQLLLEVRDSLIEAYKRQAYPFARLIKDLGRDPADDSSLLFDVILAFHELHGALPDLPLATTITFAQDGEGLTGKIEFTGTWSERRRAQRLGSHLLQIVANALDVEKRLADLRMLTDAEFDEIVHAWNNTAADYPRTSSIHRLFEEQAERTPDAVAATAGAVSLSYLQLNDRANRLARSLRAKGVGAGAVVGIALDRSLQMLVAILGTLKAGGAYLPIELRWPPSRVALVAQDSAVRVVLTNAEVAGRVKLPEALGCESLDIDAPDILARDCGNLQVAVDPEDAAYILYTSGSTGQPKGIVVQHRAVVNYLWWARKQYLNNQSLDFSLLSPVTFDLTVTSIFLPLIAGGRIVIYSDNGPAGEPPISSVLEDNCVDIVKLTPSHLQQAQAVDIAQPRVKKLILGGEELKSASARSGLHILGRDLEIYNEYGPTETTVGCMIHQFDAIQDTAALVPIGRPVDNVRIYLLDKCLNPVPVGVVGEIHVAGEGVARGYLNRPDLTADRFVPDPFVAGARMYCTGDLGRWGPAGTMEFCGRLDHQVKIGDARVEFAEVEATLSAHPDILHCVVDVVQLGRVRHEFVMPHFCTKCGLPTNFPGTTLDAEGVCNTCLAFESYKKKALRYFQPMDELRDGFEKIKARRKGGYDCLMLYSGGKHSTYALHQLAGLGLRILAFTLDNGYLSERAKENIRRVVTELGIDHMFGSTPFMRDIFAESLRASKDVCSGCFNTIYTISTKVAHDKDIGCIVTGLSRGQLFETRLGTFFDSGVFDADEIDRHLVEARKRYHRTDDIISRSLDVAVFRDDEIYDRIRLIDFYRYCDVSDDDIQDFLRSRVPWIRPEDGRSTNCIINEVGTYVHKNSLGYHNHAWSRCWDVRLGRKTRDAVLQELDKDIDVNAVSGILTEIGYEWDDGPVEHTDTQLVGYYVSERRLAASDLQSYLSQRLPHYMIPSYFIRLDGIPLTSNGKVDRKALPKPKRRRPNPAHTVVAPSNPIETELAAIWKGLLGVEQIGVHDNFFDLGGHSLLAARVMAHVRGAFGVDLPMRRLFEAPTIAAFAEIITAAKDNHTQAAEPALVPLSRDAHRRRRSSIASTTAAPAK